MNEYLDFLLTLLAQFAGGPGPIENNLMRFGLPAILWAGLWVIAWYRQRQQELPRERWLVWGFGLAFFRELFMFSHIATVMLWGLDEQAGHFVTEPLEHALSMAALIVIAASFLRYILDDGLVARRYLWSGLSITAFCFLINLWWWPYYSALNPTIKFHQSWGAWFFHIFTALFIVAALVLLSRRQGWLRNTVSLALVFFLLSEIKVLGNFATGATYNFILCPIGNGFYTLGIVVLGYVYIRELFIERHQAEETLKVYRDHLEELVVQRTTELTSANNQLQQEMAERLRAEEALRESETRFRRVISSISDHIYMTEITPAGERLNRYISPNVAELTGYPVEQFMADWNFWPTQLIHPDDRAIAAAHALHLPLDEQSELEYRLVRADGQILWVRDSARIEDHNGSKIVYGVVGDITERKRAEAALERLSRQNQLILNSAGEGIFGVDLVGNHTFVNPAAARMLGYQTGELIGRPSHATWHHSKPDGSPYPEAECPLHTGYKSGAVCSGDDQVFWRKDGSSFPVRYMSNPIYEKGELAGAVVVFKDITERKRTEAEIARQNARLAALAERQRIAAEMHDGLAQTLSYLGYRVDQTAQLAEAGQLQQLSAESDHLRQIVDRAGREVRQAIASLQQEPQPPQPLQHKLAEIIDQYLTAGGRDGPPVALRSKVDEPVFLSLDQAEQVGRIVQEGLLNISRHARATRATVFLERYGADLTIIIEDNGQGFEPAQPPADGRDHFGLKIMRARAARLGGQIQVDSQPGQGSRITLTWPYQPGQPETTPAQLQPTAHESSVMTPI